MEIVDLPASKMVPRDGRGTPWVVLPEGGKPQPLVRTTAFVDVMDDKTNIINWKTRNVLSAALLERTQGILDAARGLDPNGSPEEKQKLNALVEAIMDKSGANDKREKGTYLHALSELVDAGLPLPEDVTPEDAKLLDSYKAATTLFVPQHVEQFCVVPRWLTGGTPDRVSLYTGPGPDGTDIWFDDELIVTDLKTGNITWGALKMAGQLATYSESKIYHPEFYPLREVLNKRTGKPVKDGEVGGAKSMRQFKETEWEPVPEAYEELGNINKEWGVIMHLPSGGGECTLHWIDLKLGAQVCDQALSLRALRKQAKDAMIPMFGAEPLDAEERIQAVDLDA